jgi:hypothetical protein
MAHERLGAGQSRSNDNRAAALRAEGDGDDLRAIVHDGHDNRLAAAIRHGFRGDQHDRVAGTGVSLNSRANALLL